MTLSVKQRATVNAALCLIHDEGGDANAVTEAARAIMATGHSPVKAYERALNQYAASNPTVGAAINTAVKLIEASSPATVAQYDQALSGYIASGDNSGLLALAPMIAEDSIALAIHNGELTEADRGPEALAMAFGFEPGPVMQEAAAAPASAPAAPETASTASQISAVAGPGMIAPKAQRSPIHPGGFAAQAGPGHGLTPAAAKEAARAAIVNGSRAIIEDGAEAA